MGSDPNVKFYHTHFNPHSVKGSLREGDGVYMHDIVREFVISLVGTDEEKRSKQREMVRPGFIESLLQTETRYPGNTDLPHCASLGQHTVERAARVWLQGLDFRWLVDTGRVRRAKPAPSHQRVVAGGRDPTVRMAHEQRPRDSARTGKGSLQY